MVNVVSPEAHVSEETKAVSDSSTVDTDVQRWIDYVRSLPERGLVTSSVSTASSLLWQNLIDAIPSAYPPDASPTAEGTLLMSWIRAEHHLEVEVMPSGQYVWFYRNHELNQDDLGRGNPDDGLDPELVARAQVVF